MKKITAVLISILVLMSFAACGDDAKADKSLSLDLAAGSLEGLKLGMTFDEFKEANIITDGFYTAEGESEGWDYYRIDGDPNGGTELCGYPASMESYYKDGKLYYISLSTYLNMDDLGVTYDKRGEVFDETSAVMEDAVVKIAGEANFVSRSAMQGAYYPEDGDDTAYTTFTYFIKDGKALNGEIKLSGTMEDVIKVYEETDFDYVVVYMASKEVIMQEEQFMTNPHAGVFSVGLFTKDALLDEQNRNDFFNLKYEEWLQNEAGKDPGLGLIQ